MRILFMAEAVTLAHLARPAALAASLLEGGRHTLFFARPSSHAGFVRTLQVPQHDIVSVPSADFISALAAGRPVLSADWLHRQVKADLRLFDQIQPDLVVGDFRLSLSVSARLARVPYATISNLYWSTFSRQRYPLPVLPWARRLPLSVAQALFNVGLRLSMPWHTKPMNEVRCYYGLQPLNADLRSVYTDADHVLYTDLPEYFDVASLADNHHILGPLVWSPDVADPAWMHEFPSDRAQIYVNLGSSGSGPAILRSLLDALGGHPWGVFAATAGLVPTLGLPAHVRVAPYLHGVRATLAAKLVVCNGGSMATQQALLAGRPVLGIASNMDQFMNMQSIVAAGAGMCLRADRITPRLLVHACAALLEQSRFSDAARRMGDALRRYDAASRFETLVPKLVHTQTLMG